MVKLQLSLRARIFLSMIILILITFILTGAVLVYHFQREEEEYHKERLKRKEYAVRSTIDYFLTPYKDGLTEKELPEMFSDKICEIADIHNLDVAIYSVSGYLLIASNEQIVEEGIVPGGGTTLAHMAPILEEWAAANLSGEELIGANIYLKPEFQQFTGSRAN
mgnify:CR=1 FL=1